MLSARLADSISSGNPFDDPRLVCGYENWYAGSGRRADRLEKRLLRNLLAGFPGAATVLDVGCGTGHFTRWMTELGLKAVGLDLSAAMLSEARKRNGVSYVLGDATALPFSDRSFDLTVMTTTLEFVPDACRALHELIRVAAQGIILGVLNWNSLLAARRRRSGKPPWDSARFFSPGELVSLVRDTARERLLSVRWKTTLWPLPIWGSMALPWGGFIGLAAKLAA
jgi:SAM-dependent methyltransferase